MLLVLLVLVVLLLLLLLVVEIGRFDGSIDGCVDGFRTASGQRRCAASEANGFDVTAQERRQCRPVASVMLPIDSELFFLLECLCQSPTRGRNFS